MSFLTVLSLFQLLIITIVQGACPDDHKFVFYSNSRVNAPATACPMAKDCKVWYDAGVRKSGVYPINPDGKGPFQVYCDMETNGGGWTVFQRRQDGSVDFYRNWVEYERGFGNLTGEFWLGLSKIHRLTPNADNILRVDLGDFEGNSAYAHYNEFEILDSHTQYMLVITNYTGTAGDSLSYSNLMKFSTKDRDNDLDGAHCAKTTFPGGWWFKTCYRAFLNARYVHHGPVPTWQGIVWHKYKGDSYSLKFTEMKLRHYG